MGNIKWGIPAEHQRHGWHQWGGRAGALGRAMPPAQPGRRTGEYGAAGGRWTCSAACAPDLSLTDVKKRLVPP